jgi:hypothetical protein
MITPILLAIVLFQLATAVPLPKRVTTQAPVGRCSSLPFIKEYSTYGIVFYPDFPDPASILPKDGNYVIDIVGEIVDFQDVNRFSQNVLKVLAPKAGCANEWAHCNNITINVWASDIAMLKDMTNITTRIGWNLYCDHLVNQMPGVFAFQDFPRFAIDAIQIFGDLPIWRHNPGPGMGEPFDIEYPVRIGPMRPGDKLSLLKTGVKNAVPFPSPNDDDGVPVEFPIEHYYAYFACVRAMSGWNLHAANNDDFYFAKTLTQSLLARLTNQEGMASIVLQLSQLNQALTMPSNSIVVPRWSVDKLTQNLGNVFQPALHLADRAKQALSPEVADQVRINSLSDMSSLMTNVADANKFTLEQAMSVANEYISSVDALTSQVNQLTSGVSDANQKFKDGVTKYQNVEAAKSAFSFLSDMYKVCSGVASGDFSKVAEGTIGLFKDGMALNQLLEDLANIDKLQTELRRTFSGTALNVLPTTSSQLKEWMQKMDSTDVIPVETRQALLDLSKFDRASAELVMVKYDSVRSYIDNIMKFSVENGIDGAQDIIVSYKKLTVAGRAAVSAKIALMESKAVFAKALYQTMMDKQQAKYVADTVKNVQATFVGQRKHFLRMTLPSIISTQIQLLDNMNSICSAFLYTEAKPCDISTSSLKLFSIAEMTEFVDSFNGLIQNLMDSKPITRQPWSLDMAPMIISAKEHPDIIADFKKSRKINIPASVFQQYEFFQSLSAVCMLSTNVEVVGVKSGSVQTFISSSGAPALQKQSKASNWLNFKTPALTVTSAYQAGMKVGTPSWTIPGTLWDTTNNFCRTPFQDMLLTVGGSTDLSGVTAIKIYLNGHALTNGPMKAASPSDISF